MPRSTQSETGDERRPLRPLSAQQWTWLVWAGLGLATLTAFRAVLVAPLGVADPTTEFKYWFFIPGHDSGALSVLIAIWLLWNRSRLLASTRAEHVDWTLWASAVAILLFFSWATWTRAQALLIPALCATLMTLAASWGGHRAVRLVLTACVALMLAFPPPAPLMAEIIWWLQGLAASGGHWIMTTAGYTVQLEGTELRFGGHAFVVIESCSGWRGIQVLSLVGLAASELRGLRLRRAIWIILAAIPLGIGLNIVRVALVMLTQEEMETAFFESHTPQGIAVLMVGGAILYTLAALLDSKRSLHDAAIPTRDPGSGSRNGIGFTRWVTFAVGLPAVLSAISFAMPYGRDPRPKPIRYQYIFPTELAAWQGTPLEFDYFYPYSKPGNPQFRTEYRNPDAPGGGEIVDLFIARETPTPSGLDRLPDSKLLLPANDWMFVSRAPTTVWPFGIEAEEAVISREAGKQLSYVIAWRVRDHGLLLESLRSLAGWEDCTSAQAECVRVVVRITAPILHDDGPGRNRARKTAKHFIDDFILPLKVMSIQ